MSDSPSERQPAGETDAPPSQPVASAAAEATGLFDRPGTRNVIFYGLMGLCALLFASDLLYHKHTHFDFEQSLGFHGLFGFVAYLTIVNSAKLLRCLVIRAEDYYDR